ncbi:MAG: polysaccharide deacetylase family protein, partial [Planctomycetes bacterium]|nr:polysaccharide deacetylase family protein [Planctomycetota bacterium]
PLLRPIDRLAPPATNTLGLIAGADVVITNNSSAGIEAALLERPVVVLGIAHYRGRGFTHDYGGNDDLRPLLRAALRGATAAQNRARERYLYELLFHELVHVEQHPLRTALDDEEYERMAIGLWDLVQPRQLGSDWHPVFAEVHSLRESLRTAVQAVIQPGDQATLLVATRFAAACLPEFSQRRIAILEELSEADTLSGCEAHLLAPDLSAGQRAAAAVRLRAAGAHNVRDLTSALSRQPCLYQVRRFNQLPRPMRDALYRQSAYWDYYLAQSGLSPENTPQKNVQAELLAEWLQHGGPSEILEYGCGDGRILARLATAAKRSWRRLTGVDSSARMLDLARDRLSTAAGVTLLPADARRILPFDDESFDTTLTCGTLQHVPAKDLPAVSRELHRVTRTALVHWEVCETHQPSPGEHYTNADTSRTIHAQTFARFGPVQMQIRDVRPLTGQGSLLARYELRQPLLTVLTLHAVGTPPSACTSFDYRNMFVSPGQLLEILDGLLRQGYRFLTLRKALACVQGAAPLQHKAVVLTFDDGYASVFDVARPLLEARGIRAAVFIPTGYVGRPFAGNTRAGTGPALPTMTAEQIRALADAGWEIGAHSVTHGLFAGLSRADARRELAASKALLEELLEQPVSTFAFPYGEPGMAYTPEHVELARTSGYELALTMRPGFVAPGYAGLDWPRIGVGSDTTSESLLDDLATLHRTTNGWPAANEGCGVSLKERVRGVVQRCVETGIERITLYGAGRHTARLLQTTPLWPLHVLGIVDDNCNLRGGQRYGLPVYAPRDLPALAPDAVLISSDQYEEAIYERIAPLEARGIRVLRLYDGEE